MYHALVEGATPQEIILQTTLAFLKLLPARMELFRAEVELMKSPTRKKTSVFSGPGKRLF